MQVITYDAHTHSFREGDIVAVPWNEPAVASCMLAKHVQQHGFVLLRKFFKQIPEHILAYTRGLPTRYADAKHDDDDEQVEDIGQGRVRFFEDDLSPLKWDPQERSRVLHQTLKRIFPAYSYLSTSIITAYPGAQTQQIHRDYVEPLSIFAHVPLFDTSAKNGGLALRPNTHEANGDETTAMFQPSLRAGDMILFFPNVQHHGMKNSTDRARHVLYMDISNV